VSLRRAGYDDVTVFEKGERVGGVWNHNTYPGAACDIPSHLYEFSFEPNPRWSRRYAPQREIQDYGPNTNGGTGSVIDVAGLLMSFPALELSVVLLSELRHLGPTLKPGLFEDRRDFGVGQEVLIALLIPVEKHPDPVFVVGIAKDVRTLGPVLLSLLSALGREGFPEAVEILDLRRRQDQLSPPSLEVPSDTDDLRSTSPTPTARRLRGPAPAFRRCAT
jgi:hypothetical protein